MMMPMEEKVDLESDEEIPFSASATRKKVHPFDSEINIASHGDMSKSWILKRIQMGPLRSIYTVLIKAKINMLLPFGPLAILLHYLTGKHGLVFLLSMLGITPLAERLGYVTEQLAFYTGPTVGGLLNATFGNATEMIISIYALKSGMIRVVQQSLLGSILSNMLLVLGCAFFSGGIANHQKVQVFNKAAALVNSGLLLMAVMGIMFPAVLHFTHTEVHFGKSEMALSRFSSCIMLIAYGSYLFFQLKSQPNLYSPVDEGGVNDPEDSDDEEVPEITQWETIGWLAILTLWISILSGYLVDAIQGASDSLNMPVAFISVILLPIVGNAAEHASAIMFAMKDKLVSSMMILMLLDITIGVAIGSSTQISMFVIPFCVVVGWCMGQPMDLNFQLFETATLFISVLVVAFMLQIITRDPLIRMALVLSKLLPRKLVAAQYKYLMSEAGKFLGFHISSTRQVMPFLRLGYSTRFSEGKIHKAAGLTNGDSKPWLAIAMYQPFWTNYVQLSTMISCLSEPAATMEENDQTPPSEEMQSLTVTPSSSSNPTTAQLLSLEERFQLVRSVGEECIQEEELRNLLEKKPLPICYDGFEPSGRMHIAQGVMKTINVNKLTKAGCKVKIWIADWFAQLNNKMGGDLKKIKAVGEYLIEIWKAVGMDIDGDKVEFLWSSDEINSRAHEYWPLVMDIARRNKLPRIMRCVQIMGRSEQDELTAAQIFYPCMQCADIFFLKADICQLGMDQRKVNVLAREYCDDIKRKNKPIILSHHMLPGLQQGQEKMSKSDPSSSIFMEDEEVEVRTKIKKAYCPPQIVEGNPCMEYIKHIVFPWFNEFKVERNPQNGGEKIYKNFEELVSDYESGGLHPGDLKPALTKALNTILQPVRDHFSKDPKAKDLLKRVKSFPPPPPPQCETDVLVVPICRVTE
ncbi:hypothetical protein DKX38_016690 [Salix brachista]|uniref:tyrosine--tRNA ligase n=1 Tax=Salix brachista TaxID=2182728 RepID=A0A5N5L8P6_9ROSI|nr:hypothetical protein DKX38_016690 [Salix brachista]